MKMLWPEAHRNLTLYFLWEQCFSKSLIHYLYWPYRIYCEQTQVHWRALPSSESTIGSQWCSGTVPIRMPFGRNYPCWRSHVSWVSMSESFGKANSLQGLGWVLVFTHWRHLQSQSTWLTREMLACLPPEWMSLRRHHWGLRIWNDFAGKGQKVLSQCPAISWP